MPVSERAAILSGQAAYVGELAGSESLRHTLLGPHTRLGFLADIIPLPSCYPLARVLSIGDLLIFLGILVFIICGMRSDREDDRGPCASL